MKKFFALVLLSVVVSSTVVMIYNNDLSISSSIHKTKPSPAR